MKNFLFLTSLFFSTVLYAQIGIGTANPDSSAMLDIKSDNRGFLLPRINLLSQTDVTTIVNPAVGLTVYNTGSTGACMQNGLYFYDGTKWVALGSSSVGVGNTFVTNIVRDPSPGYGGYVGTTPPAGFTVNQINASVNIGSVRALFNGNTDTETSTFHLRKADLTPFDWGTSFAFDQRIRFTNINLNGRTIYNGSTLTTQQQVNRIGNIVAEVLLCGEVQWTSAPLPAPVSRDDNNIAVPNIIGDEIRLFIPNGGNTAGSLTNVINYEELIISGQM